MTRVILAPGHPHLVFCDAMLRSRKWCFTINNPTEWDEGDIQRLRESASYVIVGKETGESGTPHFQGFCYFKERKSLQQVKAFITRAHLEPARGTNEQAADYCRKDGDWREWGDLPCGPQGQKNKWKEVLQLARAGKVEEIEDKFPAIFLRYHSKLLGLFRPELPLILDELQNEWWYGETGTGKSRELWRQYPNHFQKSLNKWWDGYNNEEVVAIEEWSPKNDVTSSFLKIWADRYPFTGEIKGGTLQKIRPKKIIVLSNYTIEDCFYLSNDLGPIKRRFKIKQFISL